MELLIGSGYRREKLIVPPFDSKEWLKLTTLDINPNCKPDVVHDLNVFPYPFEDNTFNQIHAYEVLEHCGQQGDYKYFFKQWDEFYRIMRPNALFCGTCPSLRSPWLWGDPSHTRVITRQSLVFLDRRNYGQLGNTPISDFCSGFRGDFRLLDHGEQGDSFWFVLEVQKDA